MKALIAGALAVLALAAPAAAAPIIPLGDPFAISSASEPGDRAGDGSVAYNPAAQEYLTVYDVGETLMARRHDASGAPIGAEFPVTESFFGYGPSVIWDPASGRYVVAYPGHDGDGEYELWMTTVAADGSSADVPKEITNFGTPADTGHGVFYAGLARGSDACPYLVAFSGIDADDFNVHTQLVDDDLTACGGPLAFDSALAPAEEGREFALTFLPDSQLFVVARATNLSLELDTVTAGNQPVAGDPVRIAGQPETENYYLNLLTTGPADRHVLVWEQSDGADYWVSALAFDGQRQPLSAAPRKVAETAEGSYHDVFAAWHDELGMALVSWSQVGLPEPAGPAANRVARVVGSDGTPLQEQFTLQAGAAETDIGPGGTAAGANRDWLATWSSGDPSDVFSGNTNVVGRLIGENLDVDGDGVQVPADCDDANPEIPRTEVPGNGVDEDCSGADGVVGPIGIPITPATLDAKFKKGRKRTRVRRLRVLNASKGMAIRIRCAKRKRCPKRLRKRRSATPLAPGTVNIRKLVGKRLKHRVRLTVVLEEFGLTARRYRFTTRKRKLPIRLEQCIPPGGKAGPCA